MCSARTESCGQSGRTRHPVSESAQHDSCEEAASSSDGDAAQRIASDCGLELRSLSLDGIRRFARRGGDHLIGRRHRTFGLLFKFVRRFTHHLSLSPRLQQHVRGQEYGKQQQAPEHAANEGTAIFGGVALVCFDLHLHRFSPS